MHDFSLSFQPIFFKKKIAFHFQDIEAGGTLCKPRKKGWKYLHILYSLQISQHKYLLEASSASQSKRTEGEFHAT